MQALNPVLYSKPRKIVPTHLCVDHRETSHFKNLSCGPSKSLLKNGILLQKLFRPTVRKKYSSDREKLLKFEVEGREFAKFLRSLEQFIQTVKGQNNFW